MLRFAWGWVAVAGVCVGCGPSILLSGDTEGVAASEDSTGGGPMDVGEDGLPPTPATTTSPASTSTSDGGPMDTAGTFGDDSDDGSDDVLFILDPDVICGQTPEGYSAHCTECDTWAQDCPRGEKCMPWANDGGNAWNATRCSPVEEDADAVGEPCTVQGSAVSGVDSCALGAMCFYVDPGTLQGTCIAMCQGAEDNPVCPADSTCLMSGEGTLNLCLPTCDPLAGACPLDQVCQPVNADFFCVPSAGEPGAAGETCELLGDCTAGLACIAAEHVAGCETEACCSPFCNVNDGEPNPACAAEQTCTAWYRDGEAPVGFEHVGVCTQ